MKKVFLLLAAGLLVTSTTIAQSAFSWDPSDLIVQDVDPDLYTEMDIHQINQTGGSLVLGIEVVYNTIPATWDGMICIQGLCLGSIQPVGFTEEMAAISDSVYGYTKLTVFPDGGTESGELRIRVYDVNNPTDGDTCTWIVNSVAPNAINENEATEVKVYPNPASNLVHISSEQQIDQISIIDVNGKQVLIENFNGTFNATADIHNLPSGNYVVRTFSKGQLMGTQRLSVNE